MTTSEIQERKNDLIDVDHHIKEIEERRATGEPMEKEAERLRAVRAEKQGEIGRLQKEKYVVDERRRREIRSKFERVLDGCAGDL